MVIIGISMSLVGPNIFNSIERQPVNIERQLVRMNMEYASSLAYSKQQSLLVEFDGKQIVISDTKGVLKAFDTQHLFFEPQGINISSSGFVDNNEITYTHATKSGLLVFDLPLKLANQEGG